MNPITQFVQRLEKAKLTNDQQVEVLSALQEYIHADAEAHA